MSVYVIVESGVVVNRVLADSPLGEGWIQSDTAQIDWLYDESTREFNPPPPPPPFVPDSVTKRQGRQQMIKMGIMPEQVDALIDVIEDPVQRALERSFWQDSARYERHHPEMISIAINRLGLTSEQLDVAFIEADKL